MLKVKVNSQHPGKNRILFLLVVISRHLFHQQIIEAYLWFIEMENRNFFAADTTVLQIVSMGGSMRCLWKGAKFQDVEIMVISMKITTQHWTLLVCSVTLNTKNIVHDGFINFVFHLQAVAVKQRRRLYFDPLHSKERRMNGNDRLCTLIDNIRCPCLT